MSRFSIILLSIIATGVTTVLVVVAVMDNDTSKSTQETATTPAPPQPQPKTEPVTQSEALPARLVLNVPFFSQAPFGVWDELHGEACEEASFLMVKAYVEKKTYDLEEFDQQIINFIHWQTDRGYKVDITLAELAEAAKLRYGFTGSRIIAEPTVEQIKKEIVRGRLVIVPASGRMLPNPNFRSPGPLYHMLVVKGYDSTGFITNDPGTRNGNNFHYRYEDLYNAIHDWNPADIDQGRRAVLVFDR